MSEHSNVRRESELLLTLFLLSIHSIKHGLFVCSPLALLFFLREAVITLCLHLETDCGFEWKRSRRNPRWLLSFAHDGSGFDLHHGHAKPLKRSKLLRPTGMCR